jgi:hypothetical protein
LLHVHLFDQIFKPGLEASINCNLFDSSKLKVGVESTLQAVRAQGEQRVWGNLENNGTEFPEPIQLNGRRAIDNFPALHLYGVPLVATAIHSVFCDIVIFSKHSVNVNILIHSSS